ncbi:hypothetical protein EZS27_018026 [termite gut metagenome]|uniref:Uncharacterized protein n=1 Tax=termite gut metagenome TaxID=433724 RepID=A0A5J4RIY3_9ZZZZ
MTHNPHLPTLVLSHITPLLLSTLFLNLLGSLKPPKTRKDGGGGIKKTSWKSIPCFCVIIKLRSGLKSATA